MIEPIDPALARRLDAFTVPALPADFADGLVAAALAGPPAASPAAIGLPVLRRPAARRWLRSGAAGLGVIAVGMISITAAAMGYFGEPIRQAVHQAPVVGKVIERVLPRSIHHPRHVAPARVAKPQVPQPVAPAIAPQVLDEVPVAPLPRFERRQRLRVILADPQARRAWIAAHPRVAQRMALHRAEMRRRRAEAGFGPPGAPAADMPLHGPMRPLLRRERQERGERIGLLRERRQLMRERRGMLQEGGNRPFRFRRRP